MQITELKLSSYEKRREMYVSSVSSVRNDTPKTLCQTRPDAACKCTRETATSTDRQACVCVHGGHLHGVHRHGGGFQDEVISHIMHAAAGEQGPFNGIEQVAQVNGIQVLHAGQLHHLYRQSQGSNSATVHQMGSMPSAISCICMGTGQYSLLQSGLRMRSYCHL